MAKWGEGDPRWIVEERPDATNVNNWHWTEKNASDWSKNKFQELLVGLELNFDDNLKGHCKITEISRANGEASANNRKAKLIFFFEWDLELKFEATLTNRKPDDDKITGQIEIPNLSDENTAQEVDINVKMDVRGEEEYQLKEIIRKKFANEIRCALGNYIKQLKEEYSKDLILPTKRANNECAKNEPPIIKNSLPEPQKKPEPKFVPKVTTSDRLMTLTVTESFMCSSQDLYNVFTKPEMVQAFTRGPAQLEAKVGGGFALFGGHIEGKFAEMKPGEMLAFSWRMKNWPNGHHSTVVLEFKQQDGATMLHLSQNLIPEDQYESTKEGWRRYYFEAIKQTFGFGATLF